MVGCGWVAGVLGDVPHSYNGGIGHGGAWRVTGGFQGARWAQRGMDGSHVGPEAFRMVVRRAHGREWVAGGLGDVPRSYKRCRWAGIGEEGYRGVTGGFRVVE